MRLLSGLSLVLLSTLSACGNDDPPKAGSGGGSSTGARAASGGQGGQIASLTGGNGGNGGADAMGGDGGSLGDRACTSLVVAEGPTSGLGGATASAIELIDDFQADESPWLPLLDGRDGTWVAADFLTPSSDMNTALTDPQIVEEDGNLFARISCQKGSDEADAACNTAWGSGTPFQWAALSVLFVNGDDTPCYDASVYSGVVFRARSDDSGQKLRLQLNTPSDQREQNNSFNSDELTLGDAWKTFSIPFSQVKLERGGETVEPSELESLSFVVRNVAKESDGKLEGESLLPYAIEIDDVSFY